MEESPLAIWEKTAAAAAQLRLREVQSRSVPAKQRSRFRQTRRDKAWALREDREEHRVELWHFQKAKRLELCCPLRFFLLVGYGRCIDPAQVHTSGDE